jgi:UDP-glucose 4-epimerase
MVTRGNEGVSTVPADNSQQILVTGGAGFIGSHTVDRLVTGGYRVIVLDDFSSGKLENLARWTADPRVEIVTATIVDGLFAPLAEVTRQRGPIDRIIHLAAQVAVKRSIQNPLEDIRSNYTGTVQVLEYARCCGIKKVVLASSAAVYGDAVEPPVRETATCKPVSPYGINKLGAESFLYYYSAVQRVPTTALRFFNVYGPRQDPGSPYSGVISIFMERALAGKTLTVFGDGRQTRDFIFVGDVACAAVSACFSNTAGSVAVNIGTGIETTINDLARLLIGLCSSPSTVDYQPERPGDIVRSAAAVERAEELLGFRANITLQDGLRETLAWMKSAGSV